MARKIDTDANIGKIRLQEQGSNPSAAASGYGYLYIKDDGKLFLMTDDGRAIGHFITGSSALTSLGSFALIAEQQPSGTNAGTFTAGSYVTRVLNTKIYDDNNIVSLTSNQMTLTSGTYQIEVIAPAVGVNSHKAKLANITDGTVIATSDSGYAAAAETASAAIIKTRFTLGGTKALEVQHRCQTTKATYGLGAAHAPLGSPEIYTTVSIWKEP